MPADYDEASLPPNKIEANGRTWRRENFDSHGYQWVRPMNDEEYNWDPNEVELIDTDSPIRVVELMYNGDKWQVSALETAGPNYHRPGFTELISSDFSKSNSDFEEAISAVETFIKKLS